MAALNPAKFDPARRVVSLTYHDVLEDDSCVSGFTGVSAAPYKISRALFEKHLDVLASLIPSIDGDATDFLRSDRKPPVLCLTFDDGGKSSFSCIAPLLEKFGWKGHFFITTKFIDTPGFMTRDDIVALRKKGHIIGSHSYSHPLMARLPFETLKGEWSKSLSILREILGEEIQIASIPGGGYSKTVAHAASEAGLKILFTSQPTNVVTSEAGCYLLGRYCLYGSSSETRLRGIVGGNSFSLWRESAFWALKGFAKTIGGNQYFRIRKALLSIRRPRA